MRKLYAPHQALRASFPHRGKPRVNQKRGFACARIVLIASSILHFIFYILHLEETRSTSRLGRAFAAPLRVTGQGRIAQGRGRVAYAARG